MLKGRLGLDTARVPHVERHGLLWLARGRLYVDTGTLRFTSAGSTELPAGDYSLPFQLVSCILAGPGTTVTHDALRLLARHGTGLVAMGKDGVRHYASMPFGPDASALARRHARTWADTARRLDIARRMYAWRLGEVLPSAEIHVLRGIEGARVKEVYKRCAEQYGIPWRGRRYDRSNPTANDDLNQAINHAATAVQAAAMVATAAVGAIPQLGFIHEDSGVSFCLDVADLYRDELTVPEAFAAAREAHRQNTDLERTVRQRVGATIRIRKLIPDMIGRIKELLSSDDGDSDP